MSYRDPAIMQIEIIGTFLSHYAQVSELLSTNIYERFHIKSVKSVGGGAHFLVISIYK